MSDWVQTLWPIVVSFAAGGGFVLSLWVNSKVGKAIKEERVDEKLADLAQRINEKMDKGDAANGALFTMVNERAARLEGVCGTLTPAADFHKSLLQIGEIGGDMKAIRAELSAVHSEMKAQARSIDRVNDYLLANKS